MNRKRIVSLALIVMLLANSFAGYAANATFDAPAQLPDALYDAIPETLSGDMDLPEDSKTSAAKNKNTVSGTLASGIEWSLTPSGMLTLSGTGSIEDFSDADVPWSEKKQTIKFVYISDGIESIGKKAFSDLPKLQSVYISETVVNIGESAFENCDKLKEISFSDSVKTIGANAFAYCESLKSVTIPSGVTEIGVGAFSGCNKLKEFDVENGNKHYSAIDGVLFGANGTVLVSYPDAKKDDTYKVPQGVVEIGESAFDNCEDLVEIVFPDTLKTIGANAFYECSEIEVVDIPASVTEIAQSAFLYGTSSLTDINVSEDNKDYSSENGVLFDKGKTKLIRFPAKNTSALYKTTYTMPRSIKVIGQEAFLDCETIEKLVIHGTLEKIELAAFMIFDPLKRIEFKGTKYNWELVEKDLLNDKLNDGSVKIVFMEGELEKEFNAEVGETYYLSDFVDLKGNEALLESLVVSSSDTRVAVVDAEAMTMTAISEGEAIINAVVVKDGTTYAAACKVIVSLEGDELKEGTFALVEGETIDLKRALAVPDEFLQALVWKTSNGKVATVENGVVTAVADGSALIIATLNLQGTAPYSIRCEIAVEPKYTDEKYFNFDSSTGTIKRYIGPDSEVMVPAKIGGVPVTAIGNSAFRYCGHVIKVELPETVTTIGAYAFGNCLSLSNVRLHEGITSLGNYAFQNCDSLINVTIPSTISNNGMYWFDNCDRLNKVTFAAGRKTIKQYLRGSNVKVIDVPGSVTTIDSLAFANCNRLSQVTLRQGLTTVGYAAFYACQALKNITIPNTVTSIGNEAFYNCKSLTGIVIPDSVVVLGHSAFYNCEKLSSVTLSKNITAIADDTFHSCRALKNIDIPDGVKSIGNYAFAYAAITSLTIPNSVTTLGKRIFLGCADLSNITIGSGIKDIPSGLFSGCSSVQSVTLSEGVRKINDDAFYNCSSLKSIVIPNSVTTIGSNAFSGCTDLSSVTLGNGLLTISGCAFYRCTALTSIVIPDSVTRIGGHAFDSCSKLSSVTLGSGLETIDIYAFYRCTALTGIVIPDSVTTLGNYVFANCTNLSSATLGNSVKTIGAYAFYNCYDLKSIVIPDSVISINSDAFSFCTNLSSVTLGNGLKTIGVNAFYRSALVSVVIPDSVTTIRSGAFEYCYKLTNITLGNSLQSIEPYAFYQCSKLKSIVIPDSVTSIGYDAFRYCTNLSSVTLGNGVKTIGTYAFYNCKVLKSIAFPNSVTSVGDWAFAYCVKLESVTLGNANCAFGENTFYGCTKLDSNVNLISASYNMLNEDVSLGYIPLEIQYELEESFVTKVKEVYITLSRNAYLVEGSVKIDGVLCTDYSEEYKNGDYSPYIIRIPVSKNSAKITFSVRPVENYDRTSLISSTAQLKVNRTYGGTVARTIGTVTCSMPAITIRTAETTGKPDIVVEGIALPTKYVKLYIDGVYQKTVRASSLGGYKTSLTLEKPESYRDYKITAEVVDSYNRVYTADAMVQYIANTPSLDGFAMYYGYSGTSWKNQTKYDLYNGSYANKYMQWGSYWSGSAYGYSYTFEVKLSNRETVDKVYVVSTRSGKKEYLEAVWNPSSKSYVTRGYFANYYDYVPGVLTIEYSKVGSDTKFNISDLLAYTEFGNDAFTPSVTDFTSSSYSASVEVSDALRNIFGDQINITSQISGRTYVPANASDLCKNEDNYYSYKLVNSGKIYVLNFDLTDANKAVIHLHDFANNTQTTYNISFVTLDENGGESALSVSETMQDMEQYFGKLLSVFNLDVDTQKLADAVMGTKLNLDEKEAALERVDLFATKKQMFALTALVLGASYIENISAPTQILGHLLDVIEEDIEFFRGLKLVNMFRVGPEYKIRWVIDPSGYVYEGVTDNRLEGVTATLYCIADSDIPLDQSGNKDFSKIDPAKVSVWNAEEYDQINPVVTDSDGMYKWDVPDGMHWQVKYEKDGYETAYSEWLPVPPVQTDVNVGLVSKAAPKVEWVYLTDTELTVLFDKYVKPETVKNVEVGNAKYTLEYATEQKDVAGNVYAKQFTFKFDSALKKGVSYSVKISGVESYAGVKMQDYSEKHTTPGNPLPTEILVSNVNLNSNNISVEFMNNTGSPATFNAICAVYGENGNLIDSRAALIENLAHGEDINKAFTFEKPWVTYKIFIWSADSLKPYTKLYEGKK